MGLLMPVGVLLIVLGLGGSAASCYQAGMFADSTRVEQPSGGTDTPLSQKSESMAPMFLAPLAGLLLAAGIVCVGVGMGNWRRPIPSETRPANPWSDQPREHGDPPKGLV